MPLIVYYHNYFTIEGNTVEIISHSTIAYCARQTQGINDTNDENSWLQLLMVKGA